MKKRKRFLVGISGILTVVLFAATVAGCAGKNPDNPENLTIGAENIEENNANDTMSNGNESGASSQDSGSLNLTPSAYADSDFDRSGKVLFKTEHAVIDKEMESISYTIENLSGEDLEYGEEYVLEIKSGEQWYQVPFPENYGWNALAYVLPANNISGGILNLTWMDFEYVDGDYRIVKQLGDYLVKAEFSMGESEITPETPFGYKNLEDLPLAYNLDNAVEDGVVVFGYQKSFNLERLKDFMIKAKLGLPAMVRIGFSTVEGDPIFYDLKRNVEADGREWYTLYHDSRRDAFSAKEDQIITQNNFSYLVTDGEYIYFSNYAEYMEDERFFESCRSLGVSAYLNQPDLIEEILEKREDASSEELHEEAELYQEAISIINEMTKSRLEGNITRYRSFGPDGTYYVCLSEEQLNGGTSFGFGTKGYGTSDYAIRGENVDETGAPGLTGIIKVEWINEETARLICSTTDVNKNCYINFSPKAAIDGEDAFSEKVYVNISN